MSGIVADIRNARETVAWLTALFLLCIAGLLGHLAGQRAVQEDCTCICGGGS